MIPRVCYPDIVPAETFIATRDGVSGVDGNVSPFEIDVINRLVKHHDPQLIFEIGTFDGRTALNMAAHSSQHAKVYTLDLPPSGLDLTALRIDEADRLFIDKPVSGARYLETDVSHKITQLYGDSATFDFSPFCGKVDFLFVDGAHSYDYVLRDSLTALNLLKPNGIVLWHAYVDSGPSAWPGLTRALNELHHGDRRFRKMVRIAGTAIVMMALSPHRDGHSVARHSSRFADSSQPEYLSGSLQVELAQQTVQAGTPLRVHARAVNTGPVVWLPSYADVGPVRLGSHLYDAHGSLLDENYSRCFFPDNRAIAPGESVTFDGDIPCPPKGRYMLEFDLVADGVAWFARNGITAVKVPVDVL